MSSSRHARKLMKTVSKFQKISLQNKSAYEGSENKNFSWLPFGWSRASYQENFDGLNDTFNSTGIVADSIFMYANPEAAHLQQEKVLLASNAKCPAQRMLDQQTTHSHPKLKDLYRRRCGLPIDANEVKDPLTDEQKKFIEKLKRCPNSPPTLDQFQATQQGYSQVKTNVDLPGKAELVNELPYWVKTDTGDAVKNRLPPEGAINLRNPKAYLANVTKDEIEKHTQKEDSDYNLPSLRTSWKKAENSENITPAVQEGGDFRLPNSPTYGALVDIDIKSRQIESTSSLPATQNVFRSSSTIMTNKLIRFFSSNSEKTTGEKGKCQKLPSSVPLASSYGKCKNVTATGCASRGRENCNPVIKQRGPCEKLEAPFASYSECLKDPTSANMSECQRKDNGPPVHCCKLKEGMSIDGCDPPEPKGLGACKPRKAVSKRSNDFDEKKGGCDRDVKPFKNATSSLPSTISCPSPSMRTRLSASGPPGSLFSAPKRYYSSKGSAGKPPKSKKKNKKKTVDWLKSKSPNECKKRKGKCDPKIKPFKNTAPPPAPPIRRHPAPIITRVARSSDLTTPCVPPKRYFSATGMPKKSCFEPRRMNPKKGNAEKDMESPVSCKEPDARAGNRCARAKCAPASIECKKPPTIKRHMCPKKPVQGKRKKRVKVLGRKVLLGYRVCNKPPRVHPFQCKPKVVHVVRKAVGQASSEKRCPCFAPMNFEKDTGACRKLPNAVEPNCNKPPRKDSEPYGICKKCKEY